MEATLILSFDIILSSLWDCKKIMYEIGLPLGLVGISLDQKSLKTPKNQFSISLNLSFPSRKVLERTFLGSVAHLILLSLQG
jgi:hypothetical protein